AGGSLAQAHMAWNGATGDYRRKGDPLMATMTQLYPVASIAIPGHPITLQSPGAGWFSTGLRATVQVVKGTLQDSLCLDLDDAKAVAAYVKRIARTYKIARALVKQALHDLYDLIEGLLRSPAAAPQAAQPPVYSATPDALIWHKPTPHGDTLI